MRPLIVLCLLMCLFVFALDAIVAGDFNGVTQDDPQEAAVPATCSAVANSAVVGNLELCLADCNKRSDLQEAACPANYSALACCLPGQRMLKAAPVRRGLRWLFRR